MFAVFFVSHIEIKYCFHTTNPTFSNLNGLNDFIILSIPQKIKYKFKYIIMVQFL